MNLGALSLKWKILLGITLTSTLGIVATGIVFVSLEMNQSQKRTETQASTIARITSANLTGALAFADQTSAISALEALQEYSAITSAVIYDAEKQPFVWLQRKGKGITTGKGSGLSKSLPSRPGKLGIDVSNDSMTVIQAIKSDGESLGSFYMSVSLAEQKAVINEFILVGVITILIIAALAIIVSLLIQRTIVGPINSVVVALKDIAEGEGDLTQRLNVKSKDELGELAHWFNTFVNRIHETITHFSSASSQLESSADSLSHTSDSTNQGIKQQQNEIDQVATAVTEMNATVEEIAGNVAKAAQDAEEADVQAGAGKQVVSQTITSIRALATEIKTASEVITQLRQDSENIGAVLDVIRGIAEQTNLLALNAAIEAARAGEQGRGFAVVADEVRTLASRTQSSTQEIHEMIERLQSGAQNAVQVMAKGQSQADTSVIKAEEAGDALESITAAVAAIKDMTHQVASASEEQSAATNEISQNVVNISEVARETAQGSEEIASSTTELAALATDIRQLVNQFKV